MLATNARDMVVPKEDELPAYRQMEALLCRNDARLTGPEGERTEIPPGLYRLMLKATRLLAANKVVMISAIDKHLTTQQAANLLGVSRPTLVKLLEDGTIPYRRVGRHRRIDYADVMAHRERTHQKQRTIARELTQDGEEMGGYEVTTEELAALAAAAAGDAR